MKDLKKVKAFLFDLDGTVYIDGELIGDAKNTLNLIREKGIKVCYLTNNSSKTVDEYVEGLKKIGIYDERDLFYSSLDATVDYLDNHYKNESVYLLGTKKVSEYLREKGLKLVDENTDAKIVLLTFDKELTYKKLERANELIVKGAIYLSTHPDFVCPVKGGSIPDAGAFMELFKASSGRMPDVIIGKPYPFMAEGICKMISLSTDEIAMVGDRLYTDIAFGVNSKLNTVLVLSGETTISDYENSNVKADFVLQDINELKEYI